jgi:hypothetical protein
VKLFASSFNINKEENVQAQDILDAIETLSPSKKLEVQVPYPGKGPDFFLKWAKDELDEASAIEDKDAKNRKYYNASVYSKGAVECLIDWFLSKYLLQNTISTMAGIGQKLEALDSPNLLGISFSLFNDIVFEPRNRGIHRFELVEEQEAKHGYELANLTVKNCVNTISPSTSPLYYGDLEFYEGDQALAKIEKNISKDMDAFYFAGIGDKGSIGVLVDRDTNGGKICILTSIGDGEVESRCCKIRGNFTPEQLRHIFTTLEADKPETTTIGNDDNMRHILESLLPNRKRLSG